MKKPEDLLDRQHQESGEDAAPRRPAPETFPRPWQEGQVCSIGAKQPPASTESRTPEGQGAGYGEFVQNLAQSIARRNANARQGPPRQQSQKARSRQTLGKVLQRLMDE